MFVRCTLLIGLCTSAALAQSPREADVKRCLVTVLEQIQVPAEEAGVISALEVKEGMMIKQGTPLAQLTLERALLEKKKAQSELDAARKESENDINARYAHAALAVSKAELEEKREANRRIRGSVPQTEIRRLELEVKRSELQIEQSQRDLEVAQVTTNIRETMLELADVNVKKRRIAAPISGVVVEVHRHAGEWVNPGDPILRILRIDRLRVEGFLDAGVFGNEVTDRPVRVIVDLPGNRQESFAGKIVFVSPEIEPVSNHFRVWAEVENRDLLLKPGMKAAMKIELEEVAKKPQ